MKEFYFSKNNIYYRMNDFSVGRPTLVFIHGLSGSSSAWLEYEKKFENRYNILCLDIRGHGKSMKLKNYEDYQIGKFSDDVFELMAHLDIKKPVLISHSFGTFIALEFLVRHQDSVASSIFLSPGFCLKNKFSKILEFLLWPPVKFFGLFPLYKKIGRHIDYSKYPNSGDWNVRRMFADIGNTGLRVSLYCMERYFRFNREDFLGDINIPVLIVHGKNDTIFPVENSVTAAKKINNSKLILLDNTDHIIVLNNIPAVSKAIENFIV